MAPRAYALRRRATTAAATRERILAAATALYQEIGIAATTLQAVAARADVSRGTILHHFGGADGLVDAVAESVLLSLDLPDERILDGIADRDRRIRAFAEAMVRFYDRSNPWWTVFGSLMDRPSLQAKEAVYWAALGRLQAATFGPVLDDRLTSATLNALVHPSTLGALIWTLQGGGLTLEEVIGVVGDLLVATVERAPVAPAIM